MGYRHYFCAGAGKPAGKLQDPLPASLIGMDLEACTRSARNHILPGNNIGMVLHGGNDDLISGLQGLIKPSAEHSHIRHQVHGIRGPFDPDYLAAMSGIDKLLYRLSAVSESSGGLSPRV